MSLRRPGRTLRGWARNPRLPLRTVRMRLTLLYGALFLVSGAALLAISYTLTWNATKPPAARSGGRIVRHADPQPAQPLQNLKRTLSADQHAIVMHQLLASCAIALAIMAVLSIALGWLVAGRVLRPLSTMTAAAQRISEQNLHERLAVAGPDDELKRLGDTIDDLLARLEAAFDAQRRFVANASHELRTPLTIMRTAVDVATRKPSPLAPGVTALAGKIRAGLDRADRLVESFLTLALAQHGGTIRTSTVVLDELAVTVLADHSIAISDMRLTVGQDLHGAPVRGSEALLTHLAGNLIDNAIRHNQPGGWIRVTTGTGTGTARLVVENSGPVLDPNKVGELAQPFRREAPDRTGAGDTGVGLGLSIVAAIAATHHGTLDLQARPDGGLRTTVTLPLAARAALTAAAAP
jgi:hypothetical protein